MQMLKKVGAAVRGAYNAVKDKAVQVGAAVGVTTIATVSTAHAALPAEATAAFTDLSGAVTDILAAAWPVIAAVTVGFVTIKLFKRGGNKV